MDCIVNFKPSSLADCGQLSPEMINLLSRCNNQAMKVSKPLVFHEATVVSISTLPCARSYVTGIWFLEKMVIGPKFPLTISVPWSIFFRKKWSYFEKFGSGFVVSRHAVSRDSRTLSR